MGAASLSGPVDALTEAVSQLAHSVDETGGVLTDIGLSNIQYAADARKLSLRGFLGATLAGLIPNLAGDTAVEQANGNVGGAMASGVMDMAGVKGGAQMNAKESATLKNMAQARIQSAVESAFKAELDEENEKKCQETCSQ